jgi:putative peptide zinc metalloprotease protein
MVNKILPTILKLHKDVEISPFDINLPNKYLLKTPSGKRYEISELLYSLLTLINNKNSYELIANNLSEKIGRQLTTDDVKEIVSKYVLPYDVLELNVKNNNLDEKKTPLWWSIPLLSQSTISPITNILSHLFSKYLFYIFLLAYVAIYIYISIFHTTKYEIDALSTYNIIMVYFIYFVSIFVHELGHSSACCKFGATHGNIGIGFYLIFPVFYADVSDIWKLNKNKRLIVDLAGIYFQMIFSVFLFIFYVATNNPIFLFSILFIAYSILVALNPFFKFDGYWALSDILGVSNLRKQSKEYAHFIFSKLYLKKNQTINPLAGYNWNFPYNPIYYRFFILYILVGGLFFLLFIYLIISQILLWIYPLFF